MPKVPGSKSIIHVASSAVVYKAPSSSRFGLFHYVMQLDEGEVICSCEGYSFAGKCWHVDQLLERLEDE